MLVKNTQFGFDNSVLNIIHCFGLPLDKLCLKVGVPVVLMRNIDQ
ncbi:hypothetical protein CR513_20068, partial [Mucuna pruriens]